MQREKITFNNQLGEPLAALLESPSEAPRAYALFAHCFTCSKDIAAASRISRALARQGIATLRFDFTGLGNSDGDFSNTNFSSNLQDLISATDFMRESDRAPSVLIGHSLGGAAVLAVAQQLQSVKAVVTIAAPATGSHIEHLFTAEKSKIIDQNEAQVDLAGRQFTIKKQFLDDIEHYNSTDHIAKLGKALLVFHSPVDPQVSINEAAKIYQAAKHPKSFITLDQADHLLSKNSDAEYVASMMVSWLGRYLDLSSQGPAAAHQLEHGEVLVTEADHKFMCNVMTTDHALIGDEPLKVGGQNLGPSPPEYLLGSLGLCTTMTVRMVAERENIPLEDVQVKLSESNEVIKHADGSKSKRTQLHREVFLVGPLDEDQQQRLMTISERCPIHRTLHGEINISTIQGSSLG